MDDETAVALSDLYIQKAELLDSYTEINKLLANAGATVNACTTGLKIKEPSRQRSPAVCFLRKKG